MTSHSDRDVSELLPCPFCGGTVDVEETRPVVNGQRFWGVTCRNTINVGGTCAIEQIPSGSRETAIARWNARAIPADRVLGEGMMAVDREEWKHIAILLTTLLCDEDAYEKVDSLIEPISKLRENRDGKAWIGVMISDALGASTPEIDDFFVCPPIALRANQGGNSA